MSSVTHSAPPPFKSIEYLPSQVGDLRIVNPEAAAAGDAEGAPSRLRRRMAIEAGGERFEPTQRFWTSFFHRFGLAGNVFRYFSYDEVLARVVEYNADSRLRLCVQRGHDGRGKLLAVSNPRRPILTYDQARTLTARHNADADARYTAGVLSSSHVPRSGERGFHIGPDQFHNRFIVEVPIDGFGQPRIYLSLLRQVCSNGAVGYSRAFRSDIRIGEDAAYTLDRALGQFDHDEGFAALRQRFEASQKSWASVKETLNLQRLIARAGWDGASAEPVGASRQTMDRLNKVAGDLNAIYGMANLESLSAKRQRVLPAQCRVYDLINFASELATHRARPEASVRLQAYIGTLISEEYDLEGTAEQTPEFKDLFLNVN